MAVQRGKRLFLYTGQSPTSTFPVFLQWPKLFY